LFTTHGGKIESYNLLYKIIVRFKYQLKENILCGSGEKMNNLRRISEKRGMTWINFNRNCPKCNTYIPKYKRVCPNCGKYVKSIQGKVCIAK
jgi:hypothetical protein